MKKPLSTLDLSSLIVIEIFIGLIVCLVSLFVFFKIDREVAEKDFTAVDRQVSLQIYQWRTPILTEIMFGFTFIGSSFSIVIATLIAIMLFIKKHQKEAILFCISLIIGAVLNSALKQISARPRPLMSPLIHESSYSFPSGHAMNSFIFYAMLAYFSYHFSRSKKTAGLISFVCVCVISFIGFSRVYLGVHYVSDVIAGYVGGLWWFVTILLIDRTLTFFQIKESSN